MAEAMPPYPDRPKYFANHFVRVVAKACLANEIGAEACWLLAVIALTEDAKRYREPVTYFNEQLMPLVGLKNVKALDRVRGKAVKAGWLKYAPGAKGKAGRYWVDIPTAHQGWDDAPTDEHECGPALAANDYSVSKSTTNPPLIRHKSGEESATQVGKKAPLIRHTSGQHSSCTGEDLNQDRKTDTPGGGAEVGQSNPAGTLPFDPMRHDQEQRKLLEQRWGEAGLRKFTRLDRSLWGLLSSLLADSWWAENYPAAIAKAGRIPFLANGAGRHSGPLDVSQFLRDSDMVRKILDGVYDPRPTTAPSGATAKTTDEVEREMEAKRLRVQQLYDEAQARKKTG
jgi:hypothetical protein